MTGGIDTDGAGIRKLPITPLPHKEPKVTLHKLFISFCLMSTLATNAYADETRDRTAADYAAAGVLAGRDFPGLVDLCDISRRLLVAGKREPGSAATRPDRPKRESLAPLQPMQVFDNLYFVGNRQVSAWLLGTEKGYFLIDAMNNDKQAKTIIEAGILKLGLDPKKIMYIVVTHAHGDHYGGQNYIATTYGSRVAMSDADWNVLEDPKQRIENPRWGPRPQRDVIVGNGETLSIPGTEIQTWTTPGHTPGTISLIFDVFDKGKPHKAALWGGTGFNFGPDEARLRQYADSASRFGKIASEQGVDVFLSNHPNRDSGIEKMAELGQRGSDEPNPFVMGATALKAFSVFEQCALAQAARVASKAN
ncbi:MBL fold metallo-hydrolase [Rhizobium sp. NFR03]|uniref:MBL fold metallo-hydrolase n=1 Tax=Rhizobium sp. NFR03 TaxID=1566263 RepID=UPI0008AD7B48|nr:MBL fold metallo-hydrolase [Rhizobium sp. NFR03]SES24914.1 metallo-beta-lactamase class B [Rhizobium sp. NFR03]